MRRGVVVIDTSVLCCWLRVPGKEVAGTGGDAWDFEKVERFLLEGRARGKTFVLPVATLIETGNHIAQAAQYRYERATSLMGHLRESLDGTSPWAAFTDQSSLWGSGQIESLVREWPNLATQRLTIGDATIKNVADYYSLAGFDVTILTADAGLKAYEPRRPVVLPRRRS